MIFILNLLDYYQKNQTCYFLTRQNYCNNHYTGM